MFCEMNLPLVTDTFSAGFKIALQVIIYIRIITYVSTQSIISRSCVFSTDVQCKTLQQVLSTTLSDNSHFKLESGTHFLSSEIFVSNHNRIILEGEPNSTIISCWISLRILNFHTVNVKDVQFNFCRIILSGILQLNIQNSIFTKESYLSISNCDGMLMQRCNFYNNNQRYMIAIIQSQKVELIECNFENNRITADYSIILLESSSLNVICCIFQRNVFSRQRSSIIGTESHCEIRISNSKFVENTFLEYGYIVYLINYSSRVTFISSHLGKNNVGGGSIIKSFSDNDVVVMSSSIFNNTGTRLALTVDIISNYAKLLLDCTRLYGNILNGPVPSDRVLITNFSECQHNSPEIYNPSECIINDVSIGWERNSEILRDYGALICVVASNTMFPLWIRYEIFSEDMQVSSLRMRDRNQLFFQIKPEEQRKCILIEIPQDSPMELMEQIIVLVLQSMDPNVNISQPSVNLTLFKKAAVSSENNRLSSPPRTPISNTAIIIIVVLATVTVLEGTLVCLLCGVVIFCRSKSSGLKQLAGQKNQVEIYANDSYTTSLPGKKVNQDASAPSQLNSFIEDCDEPFYDIPEDSW